MITMVFLKPFDCKEEFIVTVTYQGGSKLSAKNNILKKAISEAESMVNFGMVVDKHEVLRKTGNTIDNGTWMSVYERLV